MWLDNYNRPELQAHTAGQRLPLLGQTSNEQAAEVFWQWFEQALIRTALHRLTLRDPWCRGDLKIKLTFADTAFTPWIDAAVAALEYQEQHFLQAPQRQQTLAQVMGRR